MAGYQFVIHNGVGGFDAESKTKIRKQAMRAIGEERRRTGRSRKHNRLQEPPDRVSTRELSSRLAHPEMSSSDESRACYASCTPARVPGAMPVSGLEALTREYNVSITDLSALTHVHIGAVASQILSTQPSQLSRLLAFRQPSYFNYVQSRYGHSECLDASLLCLISMAQKLLVPGWKAQRPDKVLNHYSKALSSLQRALAGSKWHEPEVLCATEMLALFEVSPPTDTPLDNQFVR